MVGLWLFVGTPRFEQEGLDGADSVFNQDHGHCTTAGETGRGRERAGTKISK